LITNLFQFLEIIWLLILFSYYGICQSSAKIDSLVSILESTTDSREKVEILMSIIDEVIDSDYDKAMQYAKIALTESENTNYMEGKANVFFVMGSIYENTDNYEIAIENYLLSLNLYTDLMNEREMAKLYYSLGDIYKKKGLYQLSLENCLEGLKIYEKLNDRAGLSDIYNCMGSLYKYQQNNMKALDYYNKSLDLRIALEDKYGMALSYNNIGVVYAIEGRNEVALDYFRKSEEIYIEKIHIEAGAKKNLGITLGNIGNVYLNQLKLDDAYNYISKSLKIHNEIGYTRGIADQHRKLGNYYDLLDYFDLAIENLSKAFNLYKDLGRLENKKEAAAMLSEIYFKKGYHKEAYKYLLMHKELNDSIFTIEKMKNIAQLEDEYEHLKAEEVSLLKDQKRRIIYIAFFAILSLIIIIVILLLTHLKIKNKRQYLEFQNIDLERRKIKTELELKQKELTTKTIHMGKRNELIISVVDRLNEAKKNLKKENESIVNEIIADLCSNTDHNIWEEFEIRFLKVHKGFYENLQDRFTNLSRNEKRLSAFLRLDFSTKEISLITKQSIHSINIARSRLRKKLNLDNVDISLSNFLANF